jgi:UPF0271 protein
MLSIDLNCDMGEGFGNYRMPDDVALMDCISSANIACGFHAGDAETMLSTVRLAVQKGVTIGAHPGLPDLQGFGRREMNISANEVYQITLYQTGALYGMARAADARLHHVKPHGALYNMAARDIKLGRAIAQAVYDFDAALILYAPANSEMIRAANERGLATASEAFADRAYLDDGSLVPRDRPDALINDPEQLLNQVLTLVKEQKVWSVNKKLISLKAETICIHGDGPHALPFARAIYERLTLEEIPVKAYAVPEPGVTGPDAPDPDVPDADETNLTL